MEARACGDERSTVAVGLGGGSAGAGCPPLSYSLLTLRASPLSQPRRSDLARSFLLEGPRALLLVNPAPIAVAWRGT